MLMVLQGTISANKGLLFLRENEVSKLYIYIYIERERARELNNNKIAKSSNYFCKDKTFNIINLF